MYQGHMQGKGARAADKGVTMVMKEIPREESGEGKPLLTVTSQLVNEQQESRPLLSPSIDDFLLEAKADRVSRTPTSNTAVLSPALDLLDLTEPAMTSSNKTKKSDVPSRNEAAKSASFRKEQDDTELIKVEVEQNIQNVKTSPRPSLDTVSMPPHLEKWEEVNLQSAKTPEDQWVPERRRSNRTTSQEFLWSTENKIPSELASGKNSLELHSTSTDLDQVQTAQTRMTKEQRWGSALLTRKHSTEEEFERAKAAVESDTEFWDKMQDEWEEMARRNWIAGSEQPATNSNISPHEKGYYFHTDNPFKDWPNAFEEALKKQKEGDLPNAVLLLESAILQDPYDAEAWQYLGTTQADNENEQAAIVALQRCLELQSCNLVALMALAVSLTNTGLQQEASEALKNWIRHNPKYKYLIRGKTGSPALGRKECKETDDSSSLAEVKDLFLKAAQQNSDTIDPDLQTGLGVLFNLSGEYNKAVEAFNAALTIRPQDYLLWNRLGATLANGDRSEEAVEAYQRALEIQPGFIRSRYNLGISCINLGAYREAVSNFLTALNLQRKSRSTQFCHQFISGSIWTAVRIALSLMDQPELFQAAHVGDLDTLLKAFNMD
ncbi:PEX5-related protein isoform X1 [Chiloscyllium plagiosum]|uniref:PEX5-related protein isoform X1 n=2 Tax=Chiloscyllium plagiosum TaxID=36176 RepID=UPI001CB7CB9D|nr:PEX5-related protein isoform X1 [Chiloscyllium plagiosum]